MKKKNDLELKFLIQILPVSLLPVGISLYEGRRRNSWCNIILGVSVCVDSQLLWLTKHMVLLPPIQRPYYYCYYYYYPKLNGQIRLLFWRPIFLITNAQKKKKKQPITYTEFNDSRKQQNPFPWEMPLNLNCQMFFFFCSCLHLTRSFTSIKILYYQLNNYNELTCIFVLETKTKEITNIIYIRNII